MYRFLLTPRWLALHTLVVVLVVAFTWLGSWQLSSYEEQRRERDLRAREAVPVTELVGPGQRLPGDAVDRNVTATGRYVSGEPFLVPGRLLDGVAGTYVLAPLELDGGGSVLVLRGWADGPGDPAAGALPPGPVTVTGVLRADESADAAVTLGRELTAREVPVVASWAVAAAGAPGELLDGWVLLAEEEPPSGVPPRPVPLDELARTGAGIWQNLSYAAQWWVFAVAAVVFWGAFVRAAVRERRSRDGRVVPDEVVRS
ncbi:MAG TPA: SURF1 family protein [Jiangellales bacterium]|nr:SURF1 family protein [Jiangellales bacterium]